MSVITHNYALHSKLNYEFFVNLIPANNHSSLNSYYHSREISITPKDIKQYLSVSTISESAHIIVC